MNVLLRSPHRLTALVLSGGLLAILGFLGIGMRASLPLTIASFASVLLGLCSLYWSANTLREAVRNQHWPEEALAPFRRLIDHPAWKTVTFLLFLAVIAALIVDRHQRFYFWSLMLLLQTQTQIAGAFVRPRKPLRTGARVDWSTIDPISSNHWGER